MAQIAIAPAFKIDRLIVAEVVRTSEVPDYQRKNGRETRGTRGRTRMDFAPACVPALVVRNRGTAGENTRGAINERLRLPVVPMPGHDAAA